MLTRRGELSYTARMKKLVVLGMLACWGVSAQGPAAKAAREWRVAHEEQILHEFTTLLEIPNVAADKAGLRKNAETLVNMLTARHVKARLLEMANVPPVVFGEIKTPGAKRTVDPNALPGSPVFPSAASASASSLAPRRARAPCNACRSAPRSRRASRSAGLRGL